MNDQNEPPDGFQKLRRKFVERCRNEMASLTAIAEKAAIDQESERTLARVAHSLAGAGGTFGFAEISGAAGALEELLSADLPAKESDVRVALQALVAALKSAVSA